MRANHKENWVTIQTGRGENQVLVKPGQFVFGRKAASRELDMPESSIWKRMMKLEKLQNVNIISDSKYSVISIVNWDIYNPFQKKGDSKGDKEVTSKEQARNTEKNDKNYKNDKKELLAVEKIPEKDIEIEIPLVDKTTFQITKQMAREFSDLYPAVDISQTLRTIKGWNVANPKHRKTRDGFMRHINTWLAKEQNKGPKPKENTGWEFQK